MPKQQPRRPLLKCPFCNGNHHAMDCDGEPINFQLSDVRCIGCNEPVPFVGPYCVACTIDRALMRLLGKDITGVYKD